MSEDNKKLSNAEQSKISGGCHGPECHGPRHAPICPNCGKELPPPPHHRRHGPHGPNPMEGEPKLDPPDLPGNDGK